jgi:hypothetical protein
VRGEPGVVAVAFAAQQTGLVGEMHGVHQRLGAELAHQPVPGVLHGRRRGAQEASRGLNRQTFSGAAKHCGFQVGQLPARRGDSGHGRPPSRSALRASRMSAATIRRSARSITAARTCPA